MREKMRTNRHKMLSVCELLFFFAFGICGCGQGNKSVEDSEPSSPLLSVDPATGGSISGSVTIESSAPVINPPPPCVKGSVSAGTLSPDAGRQNSELAKTVIYLKTGLAKYRYQTPTDHVVLDQEGCTFEPQVIALMTNQPLEIRNGDSVAHNVHVFS